MDEHGDQPTTSITPGGRAGCLAALMAAILVFGLTTCRKMVWGYYPPDLADLVPVVTVALTAGLIVWLVVNWIVDRRRGR